MNTGQGASYPLKILIVDDHPLILDGIFDLLKRQYPQAELLTATTAEEIRQYLRDSQPDLAILDLSIPETKGVTPQVETGIKLLQQLMKDYPNLNIMVQSSYIKALIRLKPEIDNHQGGLTIADKGLSTQEVLARINWAMEGITHTKDLNLQLDVKPEWLEVLRLAFEEGLTDKAIADEMRIAHRTVRHYWTKIQDVLEIYPEDSREKGKNTRIQTEIKAREVGLID